MNVAIGTHAVKSYRFGFLCLLCCLVVPSLSCQSLSAEYSGPTKRHLKQQSDRLIFSGQTWIVIDEPELRGPGPNRFDRRNVWLDEQGRLVLETAFRDDRWTSAHVFLDRPYGYGYYELQLAPLPQGLDPLAVFGFFTWDDDPKYANREIDIELAQWGWPDGPLLNFVVQPADADLSRVFLADFDTDSGMVLRFEWRPDRVVFYAASQQIEHEWIFEPSAAARPFGVPPQGDERIGINLWLFRGEAPAGPNRVIIEQFSFSPLD